MGATCATCSPGWSPSGWSRPPGWWPCPAAGTGFRSMAAVNLWRWWPYLDIGATQPPSLRAAALPGFLVGLGLLLVALWRLRPRPSPARR